MDLLDESKRAISISAAVCTIGFMFASKSSSIAFSSLSFLKYQLINIYSVDHNKPREDERKRFFERSGDICRHLLSSKLEILFVLFLLLLGIFQPCLSLQTKP